MTKKPALRVLKLVAIGALGAALAVNVPGCSVIGLVVGSALDRQGRALDPEALQTVAYGRHIVLRMRDGSTVDGAFAGWSRDSFAGAPDSGIVVASQHLTSPRGAKVRIMTRAGREVLVPAENIAEVKVFGWGRAITGFVVGLAVDVLVVASAGSSGGGSGGCNPPKQPPPEW